ncbi:MAG: glycosyltransferase family 39 protein [Anaerolineales bacterium]
MDADYYFATGLRIANNKGLTEPFLWNYLGGFSSVSHPSHAYWLPLTSFISSLGMVLFRSENFSAAQVGFILLAALVPPLTARIAHRQSGKVRVAYLAGFLACFPGFYMPFLPITDSFGAMMILGGIFFLIISRDLNDVHSLLLGVIVGLMHLTRTEGFLWLGIAFIALYVKGQRKMWVYIACLAGYLLIFGPWMVRNVVVFGNPFGIGSIQTMWITDYDQLFLYPADNLTFSRWWGQGIKSIMEDRLWGLKLNTITAITVQGQIYLFPLLYLGVKRSWQSKEVKVGLAAWVILFILMTILFPLQGARGGFFHAGAALQPLIWSLAAVGLSSLVEWGVEQRNWVYRQAWSMLGIGLVIISILTTSYIVKNRVIGEDVTSPAWNQPMNEYKMIGITLAKLGAKKNDLVMINNPPGYYVATRSPSIVIPEGGKKAFFEAAERYGAKYLILDRNTPESLSEVYRTPEGHQGLMYLKTKEDIHYFKIEN